MSLSDTGPMADTSQVAKEHRVRLLQAMAAVAADKGFAATTVADLVREAGVSKRSFYECFDTKEACFLALYRSASESALRTLRTEVRPDRPWQMQLERALDAYFQHLSRASGMVRTLFVEIHQLGPSGIRVRREVMQQLADFMLTTVNAVAPRADVQAEGALSGQALHVVLSPTMALAAVGGINELVLEAIERGEAHRLEQLTPAASRLVRVLTQAVSQDR